MSKSRANKMVFRILDAFGDCGRKKRSVTHWFYFEKGKDLALFEKHSWEIGFQTSVKHLRKRKGSQKLLLIIFKIESINEDFIEFDTTEFWNLATAYNGEYDGWETSIEI